MEIEQLAGLIQSEVKSAVDKEKEILESALDQHKTKYAEMLQSAKEEKSIPTDVLLGRTIRATALGGGDPEKASWHLDNTFKGFAGNRFIKEIFDYRSKANLNTIVPSEGGVLVPQTYSREMIDLLYADTILEKLSISKIGVNGQLKIRRLASGSTATYMGEGKVAPKTNPTFDEIMLVPKKIGAKVVVTNDLLRSNDISADQWIIRDLRKQFAIKIDVTALYGAGTQYVPAGLDKLGITSIGSSTTAFTADTPLAIVAELDAENVSEAGRAWVMHPRMWLYIANLKATDGKFIFPEVRNDKMLFGYPIIKSTSVSYTAGSPGYSDIFLGSWPEFIMGDQMSFELAYSREGSYTNDSGNVVSAFERDESIIRVIGAHDFNIRYVKSFVKGTYKHATS